MPYTDESTMLFGKYKGEKLANVPASYLLWLHEQNIPKNDLKKYIEDNMEVLKADIKNNKK